MKTSCKVGHYASCITLTSAIKAFLISKKLDSFRKEIELCPMDQPVPQPERRIDLTLRSEYLDNSAIFMDLPWNLPLKDWEGNCDRLEDAPRGVSRHPVVFVNYGGALYAIKEMPAGIGKKEYDLLLQIEELRLPAVTPVGFVQARSDTSETSILITRFLDRSLTLPLTFYAQRIRPLQGVFLRCHGWLIGPAPSGGHLLGDCSLSNTLFRRDAGSLQAYLVDAETAEIYPPRLPPALRYQDLAIMEENVDGELGELASQSAAGLMAPAIYAWQGAISACATKGCGKKSPVRRSSILMNVTGSRNACEP
jgi:hypothetical protein